MQLPLQSAPAEFGGGICMSSIYNGEGLTIVVDSKDAIYAVGLGALSGSSTALPIPGPPPGPWGPCAYGSSFVKLDAAGNLVHSASIGNYSIRSVAVDAAGSLYFAVGQPYNASNPKCLWNSTALVIALSPNGPSETNLACAPGSIAAITLDWNGGVYVVGAASQPFVATPGAYAQRPLSDLPYGSYAAKLDFTKPAEPSMACAVNAASGLPGRNSFANTGAVSPGEVVTLFGAGFQPGPELSVTFEGHPAPVLYADTGQINAVVPFGIGGSSGVTRIGVAQSKTVIGPYPLPVSPAVPGIFGAVNENGTLNSHNSPAVPGSVVAVFLTGAGVYDIEIDDGSTGPTAPPYPVPIIGGSAQFGVGQSALPGEVLFLGQAPGIVAGVVQLNLRIPGALNPGAVWVDGLLRQLPLATIHSVRGRGVAAQVQRYCK